MTYILRKDYKKIILNTDDAISSVGNANNSTGNSEFTFKNFNTIPVKNQSYLKIDGITANITSDAIWTVKLDKVNYEKSSYYNSDLNGCPTIITTSFNGKSSLNLDNVSLELPPQNINEFKLIILDENNNGINGSKINIEMCIEEIE